jgi:phosphoglycerate dehydrogenase-like enzyme
MVRVAILDDYQRIALASADWSPLLSRAEVTVFTDHLGDEDAVATRLEPFDVVVAMRERTPFPRTLLRRLPSLRLLVTTGSVNAAIDLAAATECGVTVCGTGGHGSDTPELTWALVMALARGVLIDDTAVRAGAWQTQVGRNLSGSTLAILGLGRIGQKVAGYAHAFGMDVVAWSPNLTTERARDCGAELVDKDSLFRRADILTVHVKLSERSRGLVGRHELALLGPDGLLVNTSRGPIVDETALVQALSTGGIAGAALDVFDVEPLPAGHPLLSLPNTILTPHVGYVTRRSYAIFYREIVEDILAWLDGTPVRLLR